MITSPNDADLERLAKATITAVDLVARHLGGAGLDGSEADLDRLQQLLGRGVLGADRTYELQCLGVAFGRVLCGNVAGLDWAVIDDEYGRGPTVRYRDTSLVFNVLTMISKRVERGEPVEVRALYDFVRRKACELGDSVD